MHEHEHDGRQSTPITRRRLLRRAGQTVLGVAAGTTAAQALAACGGESASTGTGGGAAKEAGLTAKEVANASGRLNVLGTATYQTPAAYPDGVDVKWGFAGNNDEFLQKTAQTGTFDMVVSPNQMLDGLIKLDRLEPIDVSLIENWNDVASLFRESDAIRRDGEIYALPHHWGYTYVVYVPGKAPEPKSFDDLMAPELRKKITMPDDAWVAITEFAIFAGAERPNELTRAEFDKTMKLMHTFKPQLLSLHQYGEEGQIFGRGDVVLGLGESANAVLLIQEAGVDAKHTLLGSFSWWEAYVLLKGSKNPAAVYKYMNTGLTTEGQIAVTKKSQAFPAVDAAASAIAKEFRYESADDVLAKAPLMPGAPVERNGDVVTYQEWLTAWNEFKAA